MTDIIKEAQSIELPEKTRDQIARIEKIVPAGYVILPGGVPHKAGKNRDLEIAGHIDLMTGRWKPVEDPGEVERYARTVFNELYVVYKRRIKNKRLTKEAYEFSLNAAYILDQVATAIVTGSWRVKGYFPFKVHHPERLINAPYYVDRIVEQWLIEKYFIPVLTPQIFKYNLACQEGKGPDMTRDILMEDLYQMYEAYGYDCYIVQYDIKKYFDNISHTFVYHLFAGYGICSFALYLLWMILCSYHLTEKDEECYAARDHAGSGEWYGVPKGNLPSQWTGVMLLNELDIRLNDLVEECIKDRRYMDDGLCFAADRADARRILWYIEDFIAKNDMGIRLNDKKTNIYPISRGINFCGWRYDMDRFGHIRCVEMNTKKREQFHRLDKQYEAYGKGHISMEKFIQMRNGTIAYFSKGTEGFSLTHKMLQRYQAFDGEYEVFYKGKMNPLGLRNIDWDTYPESAGDFR